MRTLIFGAGNLLLSDEGFGVHAIRYLEEHYDLPEEVELFDGGTLGIMVTHKLEEAERIYVLDVVDAAGEPGKLYRFEKEEIMLDRLPLKMSPHQIGIQEVLFLTEMRGTCPERVSLIGVIPGSLEAGCELTPPLQGRVAQVAEMVADELRADGLEVRRKAHNGD
ncbi:HyaD/HybD family hydrogenase maturation endopeptidase [Geomonas sp. RF6]|uniref:HyaD/HybD family hydrogenase maturation endopeptidase n=1 Tax=Geomonas sp. RF6 TaxID=2897342 RepID=UPI001E3FC429|nr:HyaD/HybD family hydrogenase maturation endopeptidase [Geomonas sp. RF6]UFS70193.1 HyaD/HybD family hydrogenase maturation endopeptidase [Geomonas sp. RF6]